jgi:CBS domain-containing protein
MKMRTIKLERVVTIEESLSLADALRMLKENNVYVLAILDNNGKCIGSLSDREVLLGLSSVTGSTSLNDIIFRRVFRLALTGFSTSNF